MPRDVAEEITMTVQTPTAPPETRAVLVKPGDLLLIGNVGIATTDDHDVLAAGVEFFRRLGIDVVFFAEDIRIDLLPPGDPRA